MHWAQLMVIVVGSLAVVVLRPWRFWWSRRHCPQCQNQLPRWNRWGWKEDWVCCRCGCQISQ